MIVLETVVDFDVISSNKSEEVGAEQWGLIEYHVLHDFCSVKGVILFLGMSGCNEFPVVRAVHHKVKSCLQIRLVKARKHLIIMIGLTLCI